MAKRDKKKDATRSAAADPTLPFTTIVIDGATYKMCLTLGALAEAEEALLKSGVEVNLLNSLPVQNLTNTRTIFAASLRKFHPEIAFEDAKELLTLANVFVASGAIVDAWNKALPEKDEADPGDAENPSSAAL